ncbi:MAG TPA: MDR family MFS transporter, partial [Ornithinibacter sp.]|nr:MDR family MFS transporter [Ornithinibacter sp.]
MRTIADDLRGLEHQAWATTAYLITATIVTPLYGKLGDIYGRKKLFTIAISIFIVGSVLCTFATSMGTLAFYRAVQGLGAGGLFALALAIIGDIVPPRERAKYQGYFLAVFGTASVLGPVIGGFLAGQETILGIAGWRWVFLVNVPIGIAALAVVSKTLHLRHTRLDHRIDWAGAVLLSVALVPLLLVAEQGREWGWTSGGAIACYVIGGLGAIGFFWQEWRMKEEAILPLAMFRNKTVGVSSIASVLIGVAMFGGLAALPLYLQIVKGATPTEAGLLLLPMTLGIMIGSISSGQIISRTGRYRIFPVIGSGVLAVSLFVFHYVAYDTPLWQTMIVMLAFGVGLGFNFQPLTLAVQNAVPPQQIGVATSTATFTRQIGGALGTAVFLSILFSTAGEKITSALRAAVPTPDFQAALADPANAAVAAQFQAAQAAGGSGAATGVLQDSSFLTGLDERLAKPFLVGFSEAMDLVFLVGSAVMVVGFLVMLFLPHVELRKSSAYGDRANDEADAAMAATH